MFIDKLSSGYIWPVKISVPENGKAVQKTLLVRFKHIDDIEMKRVLAGPERMPDRELLADIASKISEIDAISDDEEATDKTEALFEFLTEHVARRIKRGASNAWVVEHVVEGWEKVYEADGTTAREFSFDKLKALLNKYHAWNVIADAWADSVKTGRPKN